MSYIIETPVYINTRFHRYCEHCKIVDLSIETNTSYDGFKYTILTCEHYDACKQLMQNLKYQKSEDKEPEVKIK